MQQAGTRRSPTIASQFALGGSLAAAVAYPTLAGGGFDVRTRSTFVALAGLALLIAALRDGAGVARAARSPVALVLAALALASVLSALWTVGLSSRAIGWGLTIAGYGAVLLAADAYVRAHGANMVAAGIAMLAIVEALIGLRAVALHSLPEAERIVTAWQPGGTFEYPPALACLEVGALAILCVAMSHAQRLVAGAAAAATVLAGATIMLCGNRLALAMAALVVMTLVALSNPQSYSRRAAVASAILAAFGASLGFAILGGDVGPHDPGVGSGGVTAMVVVALIAGIGWGAIGHTNRRPCPAWLVGVVCLVAIAAPAAIAQHDHGTSGGGPRRSSAGRHAPARQRDVLHGRLHQWRAAVETWLDHPLAGAGADAYFAASYKHQTQAPSRFAHNLVLEQAAELGLLGLLLGLGLYLSSTRILIIARHDRAFWLLAPTASAFLVANLFDWTWHLAGLAAIWAVALGGLLSRHRPHAQTGKPASPGQQSA